MSEDHDPIQEAAEALQAAGHDIKPWGDDFASWLVNGASMGDADLLALAIRLGLMAPEGGLQ